MTRAQVLKCPVLLADGGSDAQRRADCRCRADVIGQPGASLIPGGSLGARSCASGAVLPWVGGVGPG
jgi:hypothetical protein